MSSILPDAAPTNWVDRYAPAGLRPWLKLGRFDRPTGIWLLMLPGWMGLSLAAAMRGTAPGLVKLVEMAGPWLTWPDTSLHLHEPQAPSLQP